MHLSTLRLLFAALAWLAMPAALPALAAPPAAVPALAMGASSFEAHLPGGEAIIVHSYRAASHGPDDPIVVVLAGGGRNGDDYRDSWIEAADRYRLLVLAPSFDERQFPGAISYNLAGMIADDVDVATLRDVQLTPPATWLYADIEAVFDAGVALTGSTRTRYDLYGHSAGGQLVHRMVMFAPEARIDRAVAANSGWYTALQPDVPFPYGIGHMSMPRDQLAKAFGRKLVVLLGERDDAQETRGQLRESPEAVAQGPHRLARGRFFFAQAERARKSLSLPSDWRLIVVPDVGHDYRRMGAAAAEMLYGGEPQR